MSLRITGNSSDAEEIMQDTLLKFLTGGPSELSPQQRSAWLARTCIRSSIDSLRRHKRMDDILVDMEKVPEMEDESSDPLEKETELLKEVSLVKKAISLLPDKYRMVVHLILVEDISYREVAELSGIGESTLRSLLMRGKAKLLSILKELHMENV